MTREPEPMDVARLLMDHELKPAVVWRCPGRCALMRGWLLQDNTVLLHLPGVKSVHTFEPGAAHNRYRESIGLPAVKDYRYGDDDSALILTGKEVDPIHLRGACRHATEGVSLGSPAEVTAAVREADFAGRRDTFVVPLN